MGNFLLFRESFFLGKMNEETWKRKIFLKKRAQMRASHSLEIYNLLHMRLSECIRDAYIEIRESFEFDAMKSLRGVKIRDNLENIEACFTLNYSPVKHTFTKEKYLQLLSLYESNPNYTPRSIETIIQSLVNNLSIFIEEIINPQFDKLKIFGTMKNPGIDVVEILGYKMLSWKKYKRDFKNIYSVACHLEYNDEFVRKYQSRKEKRMRDRIDFEYEFQYK